MGSSRERDRTNRMLDTSYNQSRSGYGTLINQAQGNLPGVYDRERLLRENIMNRYNQAADKPAFGFDAQGNYTGPTVGGANRGDFAGALGSYNRFMETGGLTGDDITNLRARATSIIPSLYENMEGQMARRRNIQGGYSPGFDAQTAELARQSGREMFNASRQAEGDIIDRRLQGQMWGTQGVTDIASRLGEMDQRAGLANAEMMSRLGLAGRDQALAATSGLLNLYGTAPGESGQLNQLILNALGGRDASSGNYLGMRYGNNQPTNWFRDYLIPGLGAAGGLMTGFGALGRNGNR